MEFEYENKLRIEYSSRRGMESPPFMHHAIEIFYLKTGTVTVNIDSKEYDMHAGDIISVFPDLIHSYYNCRNEWGYLLIVPVDLLYPYKSIINFKRPVNPLLKSDVVRGGAAETLLELFLPDRKTGNIALKTAFSQTIVGKLLEMYEFESSIVRYDEKIQEVISYIHENYYKNPSRTQIARAVGLNENYVSRIFSEKLHCSLLQYLRSVQIQNAAELLRNSELAVKEVATKTGFYSLRSFNRNFLAKFNQSPREYRKSAKEMRSK